MAAIGTGKGLGRRGWVCVGGGVVGKYHGSSTGRTKAQHLLAIRARVEDVSEVVIDANPPPALALDLQ